MKGTRGLWAKKFLSKSPFKTDAVTEKISNVKDKVDNVKNISEELKAKKDLLKIPKRGDSPIVDTAKGPKILSDKQRGKRDETLVQQRIREKDYTSGKKYPELAHPKYNPEGVYYDHSSKATLNAPMHIQQQRAIAMGNPVGSMVEGSRVIGEGVASLWGKKKNE